MATRTPFDKKVLSVLKYDTSRAYFDKLKFCDLYNAQHYLRRDEYYNAIGTRQASIQIGKIDGAVICGALWNLMEYNPVRFTTNPFQYNGKNNIFKFASDNALPTNTETAEVIAKVRKKLREYLFINATQNGQWQDEIQTKDGYVFTVLNGGYAGATYKKLCMLRDAVQIITQQNCADFDKKNGPYRDKIIQVVQNRNPQMFGIIPVASNDTQTVATFVDTDDEDAIYDKMEHLQITLDNRNNVSSDLYEQARTEMASLMNELAVMRNGRTL